MDLVHQPFQSWVMRTLTFSDQMRLLDIGTGGGGFPARLQRYFPFSDLEAADISPLAVSMAARKLEGRVFCSPAENIDAESGTYTHVTALDTVYYWEDPGKAFAEVLRVLKDDGVFYLGLEQSDKELGAPWADDNPGLRIYTAEELAQMLSNAGFLSVRIAGRKGTWALLCARKKC